MKRILLSLGTLVTGCASGVMSDGPPPSDLAASLPLPPDHGEARLPAELVGVPDEVAWVARATETERELDPVQAARGVRHIPATGVTVPLDDDVTPAPVETGELMLHPGARGPESRAESLQPRVIFGNDDRVPAGSTLEWPTRAIVKLFVTWPNGKSGGCTGSLIGRKSVITAGHCIYNPDKGGWAASVRAVPGLDGTYMPFGSAWQVYYDTVTGWTDGQDSDYDYAMITLDRNLGDATGWFGIASLSDDTLDGFPSAVQGYPGDRGGGVQQFRDTGPIETYDSTMLYYDIDTMPGESGASVRGSGQHSEYVFGVHGGSGWFWLEEYNRAARINSSRFTKILGWIESRAGLPTAGGNFTHWQSVGGLSYHAPTAVSDRNGKVEVFVRGLDGAVYQRTSSAGWTSRGGGTTDPVAVVARAPGQLDLFVRGLDGALWTKARNASGTWWPSGTGWARLGGSITGQPVAVSYGSSRLDVFARDASGGVAWYHWSGGGWVGPTSLGGQITDHPAAVSWGAGRIDLFARATNGNLIHKWWNGTAWNSGWENLGGFIQGSPSAVAPKSAVLEVLARGGDDAVWHRRYEAGWRAWESLGGQTTDEIAAVSRTAGQIDLFIRDVGGGVFTKAHNGSVWWPSLGGWAWLGGDMLSAPSVASTASNRLDVFARGSENGLRTRFWAGSGWSQ
jgi:V8-like Glu-specific endopeptidase